MYEDCVKKFWGMCTKKELKRWVWDLSKPEVRKQLIDMGFIAKVRAKP